MIFGDQHPLLPHVAFYTVTFVDANTRFTWIYLLKSKKLFESLKSFMLWFVISSPYLSKLFKQTGEVNSAPSLHTWLSKEFNTNIFVLTPIIKMVLLSTNRHIADLGLNLLAEAKLPIRFWDHAFLIAVFIINRLPSAVLKFEIPHQLFFQPLPDYNFLPVFAALAFRYSVLITYKHLAFGLRNVCFWDTLPFAKGTSVCLRMDAYIPPRI